MQLLVQIFFAFMLMDAASAIHCYVCSANTQSGESWDKCVGKEKLDGAVKDGSAESLDCLDTGVCCYCEMMVPDEDTNVTAAIASCGVKGHANACSASSVWNCSSCASDDNCNYQLAESYDITASSSNTISSTLSSNDTISANSTIANSNNGNSSDISSAVIGGYQGNGNPNTAVANVPFELRTVIMIVLVAIIGR